jgi:hypothetical protein
MIKKQTSDGLYYHDSELNSPNVFAYFHGFNENPLYSSFYKILYPKIKDLIRVVMPINPYANSGWEKPHNGLYIGSHFIRHIVRAFPGVRIPAGYSAGADPDYILLEPGLHGFVSVAGKSDQYQNVLKFAGTKIPVIAFAGTADTSENSYTLDQKTWVKWFQTEGGGNLTWIVYDSATHGAVDDKAFSDSRLIEWIKKVIDANLTNPVPQPIDDPVLKAYFREAEGKLIIETESGKTLRFTPE